MCVWCHEPRHQHEYEMVQRVVSRFTEIYENTEQCPWLVAGEISWVGHRGTPMTSVCSQMSKTENMECFWLTRCQWFLSFILRGIWLICAYTIVWVFCEPDYLALTLSTTDPCNSLFRNLLGILIRNCWARWNLKEGNADILSLWLEQLKRSSLFRVYTGLYYTTQLYGEYITSLKGSLLNNQYNGK